MIHANMCTTSGRRPSHTGFHRRQVVGRISDSASGVSPRQTTAQSFGGCACGLSTLQGSCHSVAMAPNPADPQLFGGCACGLSTLRLNFSAVVGRISDSASGVAPARTTTQPFGGCACGLSTQRLDFSAVVGRISAAHPAFSQSEPPRNLLVDAPAAYPPHAWISVQL